MKNFLRKLRLTKIDKKDKNLTETEKAMMNYMRIYKKKQSFEISDRLKILR